VSTGSRLDEEEGTVVLSVEWGWSSGVKDAKATMRVRIGSSAWRQGGAGHVHARRRWLPVRVSGGVATQVRSHSEGDRRCTIPNIAGLRVAMGIERRTPTRGRVPWIWASEARAG
jgi:hypothetical protein